MVSESVGAPKTQKMDLWSLIEQINETAAAQKEQLERWEREMGLAPQKRQEREPTELELLLQEWEQARIEQTKKWRQELGLPDPEPTELELLLQKWEQACVAPLSPEPEGEELLLPEPRGEEPPLLEPRGEELPLPEPRGEEAHTSTTAPTTTPTVQFGAAASSPSTFAPGHPAGLPRPPCAGPGAQESAALATALPLVPCSALPEHPDVAGLLPDVAIAPPVRCFAPPG
ncbi:UNVERIFIED_CONTAM: hypothetical protein FKN15_008359 [Acipenser sinensis]